MRKSEAMPKVSIIIPVYNAASFISQCLTSIVNQTFKDFEVYLVDDGSTDSSVDIMRKYCEADARFHLLSQNHRYAGVARNEGMKHVSGEYLFFLDADDFFDKEMIEVAYEKAKANDADICVFPVRFYDEKSGKYSEAPWTCIADRYGKGSVFSVDSAPDKIFSFTTPAPWNKILRRSFVEEKGLQWQDTRSANDMRFVYSAIALASRIVTLDKPLMTYRRNHGTSLQQTQNKDPLAWYKAVLGLKSVLLEHQVYEKCKNAFVSFALSFCIYNLETMPDWKSFCWLFKKLQQELFQELDFASFPERTFQYIDPRYYKMMKIVSEKTPMDFLVTNKRPEKIYRTLPKNKFFLVLWKFFHCF